jgi:hypothetical protein
MRKEKNAPDTLWRFCCTPHEIGAAVSRGKLVYMRIEQKKVAVGAASGVIGMAILVFGLSSVLPTPDAVSLSERLALALQLNVIAIIPFFLMLVTVGNSRFLSDAIDPTLHKETARQEVDGRVADNTFQQNFVFLIATVALSTVLPQEWLQALVAVTIVFILARCIFWIGYRIHPLYRAPGMSATAYMNLGMIVSTIYFAFF